jgi:hypothetical protein
VSWKTRKLTEPLTRKVAVPGVHAASMIQPWPVWRLARGPLPGTNAPGNRVWIQRLSNVIL